MARRRSASRGGRGRGRRGRGASSQRRRMSSSDGSNSDRGRRVRGRGAASAGRASGRGRGSAAPTNSTGQQPLSASDVLSSLGRSAPSSGTSGSNSGSGVGGGRGRGSGGGGPSRPMPSRSPETICPICRNQINNLCITNCNHRFCRDCIRRWTSRNATCPTCRTNIFAITNILPDGGTEIIQISRAELVAHKINEIHSILMILFTVMSHTLLPEVSNYLEQLNQIARELNVPTTTTRMENAAAAAAAAAQEGRSTSGSTSRSSSAGPQDDSSSRSTSGSTSVVDTPEGRLISISMGRLNAASALRGSPTSQEVGSTSSRPQGIARNPASMRSQEPTASRPGGVAAPNQSASAPFGRINASIMDAALRSTSGGASSSLSPSPSPSSSSAAATATQRPQAVQTSTPATGAHNLPATGRVQAPADEVRFRPAPVAPPQGSSSNVTSGPTSHPLGQEQRSSPVLSSRSGATEYPSTPGPVTRSATAQLRSQGINQLLGPGMTHVPTEAEVRRIQEQRLRDIRILTDSYNKINQVYEVLMIMHMVIHRNQVEIDPPASATDFNKIDPPPPKRSKRARAGKGHGRETGNGPKETPDTSSTASKQNYHEIIGALVAGKFRLIKLLGSGSYGAVYLGKNLVTNEMVAVKLEQKATKAPQLPLEYRFIKMIGPVEGFPRIIKIDECAGMYHAMVMELLGPSLEEVFNVCERKLGLKSVLYLSLQLLTRFQTLHSKNIIYRDVKPENFLLGRPGMEKENIVHIIDYGLAKEYINPDSGTHIAFRAQKGAIGTARYMSVNTHMGKEQSRRDDLEALGYVIIYLMRGSLPWQGLPATDHKERMKKIGEMKRKLPLEEICDRCPDEFVSYLRYVKHLDFYEAPDYDYLKKLFFDLFIQYRYVDDGAYDWTGKFDSRVS